MKACAVALLLLARAASAQVIVTLHLAKPEFIAGEPIHVVLEVTNIGGDTLLLPACCVNVYLTVPDGTRRALPSMDPCHPLGGDIDESFESTSGPPLIPLRPGDHFAYESLLRGYALSAGTYEVIAEGSIDIGRESMDRRSYNERLQPLSFIHILEVVIRAGSETDRIQAFSSYVTDSRDPDPERRGRAFAAIVEMAPPFLEHLIAALAPSSVRAIDALALIGSRQASGDLKALYKPSDEDWQWNYVLRAIARIGRREDVDFLNRVLHHGSDQDRVYAALGLGKIGGDPAVRALVDADEHQPEIVRWVITNALGSTKSALAVDALIKRVGKSPVPLDLTCDALMDLTRRRWCADPPRDDDANVLRRRWTRWWKANARKIPLFRAADGCPNFPELLPQIG
jgi:hypothetical protein